MAAGVETMFSVRKTPWHGLGKVVQERLTTKEAIIDSGLGWDTLKKPLYIESPVEGEEDYFVQVPRQYATLRSDTNQVLGIVGEDYTPHSNKDVFRFLDEVVMDPNGPNYETAGSLFGGRKVWMMMAFPELIEVTENDVIKQYLLATTTHDGSGVTVVTPTDVRVVCNNTLTMALAGPSKGRSRHKHVGNLLDRVSTAQEILGFQKYHREQLISTIDIMKRIEPTTEEIDSVLKGLFGPTNGREFTPQSERKIETVKALFRNGEDGVDWDDTTTGWGFYNSITRYVDHYQESRASVNDRDSSKVDDIWFGSGADKKIQAMNDILALA